VTEVHDLGLTIAARERKLTVAVTAAERKIEHAIRDLHLYEPRQNGHFTARRDLQRGITELIDAKIQLALLQLPR
jgi:hypothetical protein